MKLLAFLTLTFSITCSSAVRESFRQHFDPDRNILANPGFEYGQTPWGKHVSDTFSLVSVNALDGKRHMNYTSSDTGRCMQSEPVTIPNGLFGQDCEASIKVVNESNSTGDLTLDVYNETNVLIITDIPKTYSSIPQVVSTPVFSCPTSGTLRLRVCSTNGALSTASFDTAWLGSSRRDKQTGSAELVFDVYYAGTTNCVWTRTGTTFDRFANDTDCPSISVNHSSVTINTTANDQPDVQLSEGLPPGKYEFTAQFVAEVDTSASLASYRFEQGANLKVCSVRMGSTDRAYVTCKMTVNAPTGYSSGELLLMTGKVSTGNLYIQNSDSDYQLRFTAVRYPLDSQTAYDLNEQGWYVDVNIGGANPDLGSSAQSTYTTIDNGSLDMVINTGSASAEIGCAGGATAPSGLTCSAVNESVSVAFTPPRPMTAEVCMDLSHYLACSSGSGDCIGNATFQLCETTLTGLTCVSEGKSRVNSLHRDRLDTTGPEQSNPIKVCGLFTFADVQKKLIRLMYEQSATTGIASNLVLADRSATTGQRDIHITVRPWNEGRQLVINNTVSTEELSGLKLEFWKGSTTCSSSPCGVQSSSPGISSISHVATGIYQVNFTAGTFSNPPACVVTSNAFSAFTSTASTTSIYGFTTQNSSAVDINSINYVICTGEK